MFQKAKNRALRNMLLVSVLLLFVAGLCLILGNLGFIQILQGPAPAADFDRYDLKGKYVSAPMDWTLGSYAEYTEESNGMITLTAADYLVQLESGDWIAVRLGADKLDRADALMEQCDAIMEGAPNDWPQGFPIQGAVVPMEEDIHFLRNELENPEQINGCYGEGELLHLVLVDGEVGMTGVTCSVTEACITAFLALICLGFAVYLPIYAGKSLWKKDLVRYCKNTGSPESTMQQLEEFADTTPDTGLLKISDRWLMTSTGTTLQVMETPHVVWAYQNVTNQKLYGIITVAKSHALCLALDNGKVYTVPGSKQKVEDTMKGLYRQTDHIMVGYDPQLAQMYQQKNYQGLLEAAKQIRAQSSNV